MSDWHRCGKGWADSFAFDCDVCRAFQKWIADGRPDPWEDKAPPRPAFVERMRDIVRGTRGRAA